MHTEKRLCRLRWEADKRIVILGDQPGPHGNHEVVADGEWHHTEAYPIFTGAEDRFLHLPLVEASVDQANNLHRITQVELTPGACVHCGRSHSMREWKGDRRPMLNPEQVSNRGINLMAIFCSECNGATNSEDRSRLLVQFGAPES